MLTAHQTVNAVPSACGVCPYDFAVDLAKAGERTTEVKALMGNVRGNLGDLNMEDAKASKMTGLH